MLLTLAQIKAQCRIDSDITDEDELLMLLAGAAEARAMAFMNRTIYADVVPDLDLEGILLNDAMRLAMLQIIGHWYEHRSSVTDFEQSEVPMAFKYLLQPYRILGT
ncbi:head-tail connector protein [Sodalis sp. RH24]|uniref:head-tail connector protein n=1 Tax=unclassified Sodalis (in: enterobacteria) TaxID=2636512 RepID=UPI0039B41A6E